jgi:CHASE2 domain-containing sensor protein
MRSDSGAIFDLRLDPPPVPKAPILGINPVGVALPLSTSPSLIPLLWHKATDAIRLVSDAPRLTALKDAREKNIEVVERLTRQARTVDEQNALVEELESERTEFKKLEQRLSGVVSASVKLSRTALSLGVILFLASTFGLFNIVGIDDYFQRVSSNYLRGASGGSLFADDKIRIILAQNGQPPLEGAPGPTHRPRHAEMIDALTQAGASVVALDTFPDEPSEWDVALANSIKRAEAAGTHVIIGTDDVKASGEPETNIPETLKEALPDKIGNVKVGYTLAGFLPATKAIKLANEIQTSERQPWLYPSLVLQTIRYFNLPANARPADVSFDRERRTMNLVADDKLIQSIPVNDNQMRYYFSPPTEDVLTGVRRTYQDVYANRNKPESLQEFRGKIVMIGYEADDDVHYVNGVRKMPGVEIQACVASNILQRVSLRRLSDIQNGLILLLMIGIGFALQTKLMQRFSIKLPFESPVLKKLITIPVPLLVVLLLYLTAIYLIYSRTNWEIDMTYHIAALFMAYCFGNYVQEKRSRVAAPERKLELAQHEEVPADA